MGSWIASFFRNMFRRNSTERLLNEELESCLQLLIDRKIASGRDPRTARREALIELGGVERVKEEVRGSRSGAGVEAFLRDFKHGMRRLRLSPGFTGVAVLTLALGIGASSAVFSLVDNVLLEPLPYPDSERLVRVFQQNSPTNRFGLSMADYLGLQRWQGSFESLGALARTRKVAGGNGTPELVRVGLVSSSFFPTLGIEPAQGRGFLPGEDRPGADVGVVVSHAFSQRRFGGAGVVGQTILLDGRKRDIIGVLPVGADELAGFRGDVWEPLTLEEPNRRGPFFITVLGRLRSQVSIRQCRLDLEDVSRRLFPLWKTSFQDEKARLTPVAMREATVGDVSAALLLVFGAVTLVLLIALVNVANLLLARASGRGREIALRSALGAGKLGLARMLLAEGLSLGALGGLGGLVVAWLGVAGLKVWIGQLPRLHEVSLDWTAVVFTVLVAIVSGILFGMAPLLFGVSPDLADTLRGGGRAATVGSTPGLFRNILVSLEFALAVPLLVAAALLLTSLMNLRDVDPGFDPGNLVTAALDLPETFYPEPASRFRFWSEALREIRALPGVSGAAISSGLPPDEPVIHNNFDLLDKPVHPGESQPVAPWLVVDEGFFSALRVPLQEGRWFDSREAQPDSPPVAVVSSAWASRFFPGESALGKRFRSGGCIDCPATTVVGVVGNILFEGLAGSGESVYVPFSQVPNLPMNLIARTDGPASSLSRALVGKLHDLDPNLPVAETATLEQRLSASLTEPRQWALLLGLFALSAVALALIGVFGVLSYFVNCQKREIGIRMALGANRRDVVAMVARRGLWLATTGTLAGLGVSLFVSRWLRTLLFGVEPTDPSVVGGVAVALVLAALLACVIPGRRAAAIDPREAIFTE